MRLSRLLPLCLLLALACMALGVSASNWDKDDHEIFELQSALEEAEGKGTTFYSILGLTKAATQSDIKRAYRKKSLELHPDKNTGRPNAHQRFERLGLINKILRDSRKDRYDHFLTHGFPKWRGTGYFYERFRPGLVSVLVGLALFSTAVELLIKTLNANKERERIATLRRSAMLIAWGPRFEEHLYGKDDAAAEASKGKPAPPLFEKKVRVPVSGLSDLPPFPAKQAIEAATVDWEEHERRWKRCIAASASPGAVASRTVDVLVSRDECLVSVEGEWWPLDEAEVATPAWRDTWLPRLVVGGARSSRDADRQHLQAGEREEAERIEEKARQVIAGEDGEGAAAPAARKRKGTKRK